MHKIARDAYRGIGAEGFARIDFLVAGDAVYLSEINTIPGLHADQPLPDAAGRRRLHVRGGLRPDRGAGDRAARRPGRADALMPGDLPR